MIKKVVLDNGLTIFLNRCKRKNRTTANIYVKCGGLDTKTILDGEEVKFPFGVAHFLEHYLLEQSIYGNASLYFSKDYIEFNGLTSNYRTEYYISTVHDFKENFIKLLNIVNNPIFEMDKVKNVIKPVIAEINRKNDIKRLEYFKAVYNSSFEREVFNKVLGSSTDIENMNCDILSKFYKAFYTPSNEIISITGNFDMDIIDVIKEEYKKFNIDNRKVVRYFNDEKNDVVKERCIINTPVKNESITISFKIKTDKYSPREKNKLDYYLSYILSLNFGDKSSLFNKLLKDKLSVFSIQTFCDADLVKDYVLLSICVYTSKYDIVEKLIFDTLNSPKISKKTFENYIKNTLIKMINSLENPDVVTGNLIDNYFIFDLEENDSIDFVKRLNISECKKMYNSIDLSHYSVVINKGDKKDNE